ncbi:MAG: hypothetical protein KQA33_00795 [Candidatus Aenigmarchaeota archaeon]|nr:hypothetical protein [Candidatus Aenigmarchaeota archaeon]
MENMNKEFDISSFISEKQKELQDVWDPKMLIKPQGLCYSPTEKSQRYAAILIRGVCEYARKRHEINLYSENFTFKGQPGHDWLSEEFEIKKEISYKELPLTVDEIKCICYFVDNEIKDKIKNKSELKEIVTDVGINVCKEPPVAFVIGKTEPNPENFKNYLSAVDILFFVLEWVKNAEEIKKEQLEKKYKALVDSAKPLMDF